MLNGVKYSLAVDDFLALCMQVSPGLKISFTGPSDKMSDDFEFGSDICMMMSDDLHFSLPPK